MEVIKTYDELVEKVNSQDGEFIISVEVEYDTDERELRTEGSKS